MIDDEELEHVREKLHIGEAEFNKLKSEVKKLPTVEKMAKVSNMEKYSSK